MKSQLLTLLVVLSAVAWWLFNTRLGAFRFRLARALRVAGIAYLAIMAARLVTTPVDQDQLEVAGLSIAFFAALWGVAWLVTRSLANR